MKNIRIFYLIFFPFLVVKFSIYLNRHVFVMPSVALTTDVVKTNFHCPKAVPSH